MQYTKNRSIVRDIYIRTQEDAIEMETAPDVYTGSGDTAECRLTLATAVSRGGRLLCPTTAGAISARLEAMPTIDDAASVLLRLQVGTELLQVVLRVSWL